MDQGNGAELIDAEDLKKGDWVEVRSPDGTWKFLEIIEAEGITYPEDVWFITSDGELHGSQVGEPLVASKTDPTGLVSVRRDVPDWDDYFLTIAEAVSTRAKCRRRQVGAVIVGPDHRIMSTGYNGAPSGMVDCLQGGCPRGLTAAGSVAARSPYDDPASPGYCTALHAEHNAVVYAGRDVHGATCYTTDAPCPGCTKTLAGAGVAWAVWRGPDGELVRKDPMEMLAARKVEQDNPKAGR